MAYNIKNDLAVGRRTSTGLAFSFPAYQVAKDYLVGDFVTQSGILYRCETAHTSTNFATDIVNFTAVGSTSAISNWASANSYLVNNLIAQEGRIYSCNTAHTASLNFSTDRANWNVIVGKTTGDWSAATYYYIGDVVLNEGRQYIASTSHLSSIFSSDRANWAVKSELAAKNFQATTYYYAGENITINGNLYSRNTSGTSGATFDVTEEGNWTAKLSTGGADTIQQINATGNVTAWGSLVVIGATAPTANMVLTLPTATGNVGKTIKLIRVDSTTFTVTLASQGVETLTLLSSASELNVQNGGLTIEAQTAALINQVSNNANAVAAEYGITTLANDVSVSSVGSYVDLGLSWTLPSAGVWEVRYESVVQSASSAVTYLQITDDANVLVPGTRMGATQGVSVRAGITATAYITTTGSAVYKLRTSVNTNSGVVFGASGNQANTIVTWKKISGFIPLTSQNVAEYGEQVMPNGNIPISAANNTSANAIDILSFTLPSAGVWEVTPQVRGLLTVNGAAIAAVVTNNSNAVVTGSEVTMIGTAGDVDAQSTGTGSAYITTNGAETYKIRAYSPLGAAGQGIYSDQNGRTKVSWNKISGFVPVSPSVTVTGTAPIAVSQAGVVSHNTSGVTAGTYGNTTTVPQITVNSSGHVTNITNQAVPIPTILQLNNVIMSFSNAAQDVSVSSSITLFGAAVGDNVIVNPRTASAVTGYSYFALVSSANTVTIWATWHRTGNNTLNTGWDIMVIK